MPLRGTGGLHRGSETTYGDNIFSPVLKTKEASAASVQERENKKERGAGAG